MWNIGHNMLVDHIVNALKNMVRETCRSLYCTKITRETEKSEVRHVYQTINYDNCCDILQIFMNGGSPRYETHG